MKKALIIGAGIGGLGLAIRLRHAGYDVSVVEANATYGGKIQSFRAGGFRFDTGPSLFTMPHYIDELFELCGENQAEFFSYEAQPESCRYFWEDRATLTAHAHLDKFIEEAHQQFQVDPETVRSYFDHIARIYRHSGKIFLEKSLHQASTWLNRDTLKALGHLFHYDLHKSMHQANASRIGEPHLVQLFDRYATYNGSSPYRAPGILNVIPWLEHGFGTFAAKGGMRAIPTALYQLAVKMGVRFTFDCRIAKVLIEKHRVTGVITGDGQNIPADIVVNNGDVHRHYEHLSPTERTPKRMTKQEPSSSAIVFYWGVRKAFPKLGLHNIFFSNQYRKEFDAIFNGSGTFSDPTVYVNITSKVDPSDAPEGCENWFVMVNASHNQGQDWEAITKKTRMHVLTKLSGMLGENIEPLISFERSWDPVGIERDTSSHKGALYGSSSNHRMAAFLRHPNFSQKTKGLFFTGGSVHPGGGIPLALLSAKITSELIHEKT